MKSSAKIFSTPLILVLVATGLFFSSVKALKFFSEKENSSFKKMISLKPKDMQDKQTLVELGASSPDDFTFFDVLDDPEMKKYIGLDGSVVAIKEEEDYKSNDLTPNVDSSLTRQVIEEPPLPKTLNSFVSEISTPKLSSSNPPGPSGPSFFPWKICAPS